MEKFKTLKDHVYDYIEEKIRCGSLKANERINENDICSELNISRTPVREALIQLAAEGIIENQARRGFVIREMKEEDLAELYEVIGSLDGLSAMRACSHLTEKDLNDLAFYVEAMDLAIKTGNFDMYEKNQYEFHKRYQSKCGNSTLISNLENLKSKILKKSYIDDEKGVMREILYKTNEEHRVILQMFREGKDEELAKYLFEVHWIPTNAPYDIIV